MAGDKVDAELQEFLAIEQQKAQFQSQVWATFYSQSFKRIILGTGFKQVMDQQTTSVVVSLFSWLLCSWHLIYNAGFQVHGVAYTVMLSDGCALDQKHDIASQLV